MLNYIIKNCSKFSDLLITGCGTGITVFLLAEEGFRKVKGIDILSKCIKVAERIRKEFNYENVEFDCQDCLKSEINEKFDLIMATHWLFSAWGGNYGNNKIKNPYDKNVR